MAIKKLIREAVHNKYGGHCAYCGKEIAYKDMQVDHIEPKCRAHIYRARHGADSSVDDIANLNPSCRRCNHYKRQATLEGFRRLMLGNIHERLEKIYIFKVALDYGIVSVEPFDGVFYFEKLTEEER